MCFVKIFGATVTLQQVIIAIVALVLLGILSLIVHKTHIGLAMRAVEQMPKAASINGINVNFVITFTFFLGAACAAIAGGFTSSYFQYVRPSMGDTMALKAFAAAVLGGIGSLPGSIIGGIIIGVAETMAVMFFGGGYTDLVAYLFLFLVLLIRPHGILGRKGIAKV